MKHGKRERDRDYFEGVQYRRWDSPATRRYAEAKLNLIAGKISLDRSARVLDVGCGHGVFSAPLSRRFEFVAGTDLSANLLTKNPIGLKTIADASNLPFSDNAFDVSFEANLLHHVPAESRARIVAEMARVSRQWLVLIEPNIVNPLMFGFGLLSWVERGSLVFTRRYVRSLIRQAGLRFVSGFATGMITQNKTPAFLIPALGLFDFEFPLGEYQIAIARKP